MRVEKAGETAMTYTERRFWKKAFLIQARAGHASVTCAEFADGALKELQKRLPPEPPEEEDHEQRRFIRRRRALNDTKGPLQ